VESSQVNEWYDVKKVWRIFGRKIPERDSPYGPSNDRQNAQLLIVNKLWQWMGNAAETFPKLASATAINRHSLSPLD
jgi:hypothetical protein